MLTSVDSCRCDSHCLARLFENLPAPTKPTTSLMFCRFAKFFPKGKTWGRTRQRPAMTDFQRKINKFWQRFAKCNPCLVLDFSLMASDKYSLITQQLSFCTNIIIFAFLYCYLLILSSMSSICYYVYSKGQTMYQHVDTCWISNHKCRFVKFHFIY